MAVFNRIFYTPFQRHIPADIRKEINKYTRTGVIITPYNPLDPAPPFTIFGKVYRVIVAGPDIIFGIPAYLYYYGENKECIYLPKFSYRFTFVSL